MNEVKLGSTIYKDFVTKDSDNLAVDADSMPSADVFENADAAAMGFTPLIVSRDGDGKYTVTIEATTANGFEVGKSYNVHVYATIDGVDYEDTILTFIVRTYSIDDVGAKTSRLGTLGSTVPVDRLTAGEISIVVGDDYNSDLLNQKEFTATGMPASIVGMTCWFGIGPQDGAYLILEEGTVSSPVAGTVIASFELTKVQTALLTPDTTYGYSWQIENASGERTGGRGDCFALRKWDD
jgi:hypothetical protein